MCWQSCVINFRPLSRFLATETYSIINYGFNYSTRMQISSHKLQNAFLVCTVPVCVSFSPCTPKWIAISSSIVCVCVRVCVGRHIILNEIYKRRLIEFSRFNANVSIYLVIGKFSSHHRQMINWLNWLKVFTCMKNIRNYNNFYSNWVISTSFHASKIVCFFFRLLKALIVRSTSRQIFTCLFMSNYYFE